jgi:hypothetical protein
MEDQFNEILFNPIVGKIVALAIGVGAIWFISKTLQNSFFSKIKDSDSRYKAKKLLLYFDFHCWHYFLLWFFMKN